LPLTSVFPAVPRLLPGHDRFRTTHIFPEHFRHLHGAVRQLIVLQDRNDRPPTASPEPFRCARIRSFCCLEACTGYCPAGPGNPQSWSTTISLGSGFAPEARPQYRRSSPQRNPYRQRKA